MAEDKFEKDKLSASHTMEGRSNSRESRQPLEQNKEASRDGLDELRRSVKEIKRAIDDIEALVDGFAASRRDVFQYFSQIEARFATLPDTNEPCRFVVGEKVDFPRRRDSTELMQWEVVKAEKGHYLLEREVPGDRAYHSICSDKELAQHNKH